MYRRLAFAVLLWLPLVTLSHVLAADPESNRQVVLETPGLVAFWDFVKREPHAEQRFTAHVPPPATHAYPLDAANYIRDFWGDGRQATYADFPLLGDGPFGQAIRIRNESDPDFRPFLYVPRSRLHDTPLDIKGSGKSLSVVVWAIRESGNHALAGIWHEGTDLKLAGTSLKTALVHFRTSTRFTSATHWNCRQAFQPMPPQKNSPHLGSALL